MPSTTENILTALHSALETALSPTTVLRNTALPELIGKNGLVVIHDGDPGEPEMLLGGFEHTYYTHDIELDILVENGDATERDTAFDTLISKIGTALEANKTLGGLVVDMTYSRPVASIDAIEGAADVKAAILRISTEYETTTPLS